MQGAVSMKENRTISIKPEKESLRLYCYEDGKLEYEILIDRVEIAARIWEWLSPAP